MLISILLVISACTNQTISVDEAIAKAEKERVRVGILLPDTGLGDQSFNDLAINGLVEARDKLDVIWSYRDLSMVETEEEGLQELIAEKNDIIIGIGYSVQELLETYAKKYPKQQFVLVDSTSTVENIDGITFKEDEGSFLAGVVAAKASKSNIIGFVGGMEDPVIQKFYDGYIQGAKLVNPSINVLLKYANTYSDDKVGAQLASDMIASGADVLYAAAGYTGVGLLQEAQKQGVYAIGVDVDQYFYAEKAIITSMLKNVDVAVYEYIKTYIKEQPTEQVNLQLGIVEKGVQLAPIRVLGNAVELENALTEVDVKINN